MANDNGGQQSLITAWCRWVGTSEPDKAGRAVAVGQRVQREGLARECLKASPLTVPDYRSDRNAARISSENSSGSSQAAKCPPLSTSLK